MKIYSLITALLILLFFNFLTVTKCNICPPQEDIYPCNCHLSARYWRMITCIGIHSPQELSRVFRNMHRYEFGLFKFDNSSMKHIPKGIFKDVHFNYMEFENDVFNQLFEDIPEDPEVICIEFQKVKVLGNWDWKPFSVFTRLRKLIMKNVPLKGLSNFKQYAPRRIERVYFERCDLRKLGDDEFQGFWELVSITINHDRIKVLKRSMFSRSHYLGRIDFSYNRISYLPEDLFEGMRLVMIGFAFNQLTVLPESIFKPQKYATMDFQGNLLHCDCEVKWVFLSKSKKIRGTCDSPLKVKGMKLVDLTKEFFEFC